MIRNDIRLSFITDSNKTMTLTVPRANTALTDAQVVTAMNGIIGSNVVITSAGEPHTRKGAELVSTENTVFDLSA